jgi:ribose transport system substrate-binding protein
MRFALVVKTRQNPVFLCMEAGARSVAAALGVELVTFSPAVEKDFQQQVELVRSATRQRFDAILIAPADSKLLVAPLKEAADAGIAVVDIDNALDPAECRAQGFEAAAFVGVDNVEGGRLAARYLWGALEDKGEVAMLEGFPGVANAEDRKRGFHEEMAKHPVIRVVASQTANWYTEEAVTVTAALLRRHPGLTGIFCANDLMALGALQAIEQAGRQGKVSVVGFDNIENVRPALASGALVATIEQWPDWMGAEAVRAAHELKASGKLERRDRRSPVELVTTDSIRRSDVPPVSGPAADARAAALRARGR